MQFTKLIFALATSTVVSSSKIPNIATKWPREERPTGHYCPPRTASALEQQIIWDDFVRLFYVEKNTTAALTQYVAEDYIQHNPLALSGRQPAIDFLEVYFSQNLTLTVAHTGLDRNLGWVHVKVETPEQPLTAIFDLYRFDGSCIVEHWDVIQELPANAINPLAFF